MLDSPGAWKGLLVVIAIGTSAWQIRRLRSMAAAGSTAEDRTVLALVVACFATLIFLMNALPAVTRGMFELLDEGSWRDAGTGLSLSDVLVGQIPLVVIFQTLIVSVWEIAREYALDRSDPRVAGPPLWILRSARAAVIVLSQIYMLTAGLLPFLTIALGLAFMIAMPFAFRRTWMIRQPKSTAVT